MSCGSEFKGQLVKVRIRKRKYSSMKHRGQFWYVESFSWSMSHTWSQWKVISINIVEWLVLDKMHPSVSRATLIFASNYYNIPSDAHTSRSLSESLFMKLWWWSLQCIHCSWFKYKHLGVHVHDSNVRDVTLLVMQLHRLNKELSQMMGMKRMKQIIRFTMLDRVSLRMF